MYLSNYENVLNKIPNIEDVFSNEYLEFYKRHLLIDEYKDELEDYYSNKQLSVNSIIFKFINIEFNNFIKEKNEKSLENNYFNWRNKQNNEKAKLFSDDFYYKILDLIINKIVNCLDKCESSVCCNICLDISNETIKCNKCNFFYHKDCLVKYILNNFKYHENGKVFNILNYEISCPQCRKCFLTNFKLNINKTSNKKL